MVVAARNSGILLGDELVGFCSLSHLTDKSGNGRVSAPPTPFPTAAISRFLRTTHSSSRTQSWGRTRTDDSLASTPIFGSGGKDRTNRAIASTPIS
jgi:hypothetical protein